MRDAFWIWYSFTKNSYVEYTLSYEDKNIFTYFKTHIPTQNTSSSICEIYTGSDDIRGMHSILNFFKKSYTLLSESTIDLVNIAIDSWKILEIHYSIDPTHSDVTLYIYSKDMNFISLLHPNYDIPSLSDDWYNGIHMFCSKFKIHAITGDIHTSIIFTSHNFENQDAYSQLQKSPLFPIEFIPNPIIQDKKFITYEISYSIDTQQIENFTLFYFPRAKNAKSSPL